MNTLSPLPDPRPGSAPVPPAPAFAGHVVAAEALMGDRGMVLIEHAGERYVLRLTKRGKLILTK